MKISIIIPNFNGEELLKKNIPILLSCLEDFRDSKHQVVEVICIDDASTDKSKIMLHSLKAMAKEKNIPFTILENEKNLGFSQTVNKGVMCANGEFVFL